MPRSDRIVLLLAVSIVLALTSGFLLAHEPEQAQETGGAAAPLGGWPIPRHDSGHTGHNTDVGSFRPPLALLDTIELQNENRDHDFRYSVYNIVTGPKRVYAMGQYTIWGIKKDDPANQWRKDDCALKFGSLDYCINHDMAYAADRLVLVRQNISLSTGQDNYELIILHAATGLVDWRLPVGENKLEIALEDDSILLLLTGEANAGKISRYTLNGERIFEEDADVASTDSLSDGAAVIANGRFIYARGHRILAYDTEFGQQSWVSRTLLTGGHGYDLVATDDAVIASHGGLAFKLNAADGALMWKKDIEPSCSSPFQPYGAATDGVVVAITAVCGDLVVGLDYATGEEKWRKSIGPVGAASTIAIGGETLYVASITTPFFNIFALDPDSGVELQKVALDIDEPEFDTSSVLAISDGLLLIASNLGQRTLNRLERLPADLSAELSTASLPACGAAAGATATFNFLVTNHGAGTTDNTRADLTLPDGSQTLETSQGSCTSGPAPFCDLGPMSVDQQVQITATVVLTKAGSYTPGISLSSDVRDPVESNDADSQPFTVDPAYSDGLDLLLTDMEITQGIQNLANQVPLVNGKPTFVRVYGRTNGDAVTNVSAVLHGEVELTGEDLGTLTPLPATACLALDGDPPNRDQLRESFVFELPGAWWQGGVIFTAEINPDRAIPEDFGNNTLTISKGFTRLPRVCLKTYPVRTTGTRAGSSAKTDNLFPDPWSIADDTGNILSRALTMLPVREIKVYPSSHLIEEWEPFAEGGWGPYEMFRSEDNRGDVLDTLWWLNLFSDDPDLCDADDSRTHYVGMVDQGTENSVGSAGLGIRDGDELMLFLNTGPNGPQAFDDPHAGLTLAHEIGHNYDRGHVNCGRPKNTDKHYPKDRSRCNFAPIDPRGYYGLEFRNPTSPTVITPTMAGDVMSYAGDVWPSEYTWEAIQDVLCDANDCPLAGGKTPGAGTLPVSTAGVVDTLTGDVLIVRGSISPTIGLDDLYRLPAAQVPKANDLWSEQVASRPLTATYALNLISGTTILHSELFSPTHSDDQASSIESFGLVVPWDPATTRITLTAGESTVISLTVSQSSPVITALSPDGGEFFTDTLPISWAASDADGDDLRYTVLYSGDGGSSWTALATAVETTTLTVDSSLLPGSAGQSLVKVIASDGLNSASRQSAAGFTIPDRAARALIYFPQDGGVYPSGSSLTLRGDIYDPEDGYLPTTAMSWTLSGTGSLGTGNNIMLGDMEDGQYSLTLTALVGEGQHVNKTVSFRIGQSNDVFLPALAK